MGVRNMRAICPKCGAKIHTQPKGLGHITWANSGALVQTGAECPYCHVALSGKVGIDNKAILVEDAEKTWWERETGADPNSSRDYPTDPDSLFDAVCETVATLHAKKAKGNRETRTVTFNTALRSWVLTAEEGADGSSSQLQISSKRVPGAFTDYGERKRVEKKISQRIDTQLAPAPH